MLPNDILFEIFKLLPVSSIITCSYVNKQFNQISNSGQLWKHICVRKGIDCKLINIMLKDNKTYKDICLEHDELVEYKRLNRSSWSLGRLYKLKMYYFMQQPYI